MEKYTLTWFRLTAAIAHHCMALLKRVVMVTSLVTRCFSHFLSQWRRICWFLIPICSIIFQFMRYFENIYSN